MVLGFHWSHVNLRRDGEEMPRMDGMDDVMFLFFPARPICQLTKYFSSCSSRVVGRRESASSGLCT